MSNKSKISEAAAVLGRKKSPAKTKAAQQNAVFAGRKPNPEVLQACYDYASANGGTLHRRPTGIWSDNPDSETTFSNTVVFHLVRDRRMQFTDFKAFGQTRLGCEAKVV